MDNENISERLMDFHEAQMSVIQDCIRNGEIQRDREQDPDYWAEVEANEEFNSKHLD